MKERIAIRDKVLNALANETISNGTEHNDATLFRVELEAWEVEVALNESFGNSLSIIDRSTSAMIMWTFSSRAAHYMPRNGAPSEAEARTVAAKVLASLEASGARQQAESDDPKHLWWLAVNGPSCAASGIAYPATVSVHPTPEQLLGFSTRKEQLERQKFFMTAPMSELKRYMTTELSGKVKRGEVVYLRPKNPDPPTHGATMWVI